MLYPTKNIPVFLPGIGVCFCKSLSIITRALTSNQDAEIKVELILQIHEKKKHLWKEI